MTRYRTVLFDLDGTLLDHFAAIHRTHSQTMEHFGLPAPTMELVRRSVGGGLENTIHRIFGEKHANLVQQAVPVYRSFWNQNIEYEVSVFPGSRELLQKLKAAGVQTAVFTNKHGASARKVLEHVGLSQWLDGVYGAYDTPWLKPDPEFAAHALEALGANKETACLVGDSPYDVEAGKTGGFPCYCVTTGTHTADELRVAGAAGVFPDMETLGREALGI